MNATIRLVVLALVVLLVPASASLAQSWDAKTLSRKPTPVAKPKGQAGGMKACPEYGAGFYRLGGSAACVRIGGSVGTEIGTTGVRR